MANEWVTTGQQAFMQLMARRSTEGLGSSRSVTVTYESVPTHTLNSTTMQITETGKISASVTAHRIELDETQQVRQEEARGQVAFLIEKRRLDDASIAAPTRSDRITESGDTFTVREWTLDAGKLRYTFYCDKVAT